MVEAKSEKVERSFKIAFIPTIDKEAQELHNFSPDSIKDRLDKDETYRPFQYFNISFIYPPLSLVEEGEIKVIQEKLNEMDVLVFLYDTSNSDSTGYYRTFVEGIPKFRPKNGAKTYFALYTPDNGGYVPVVDEKYVPDHLSVGAGEVVEACGIALLDAYKALVKTKN